jgi:hypothetical protein
MKEYMWGQAVGIANVAHDTVTEADASESMIPLSNVFRNRITPEP